MPTAFISASGVKLALLFGDGASPETFNKLCSITAKSVRFEGQEATFAIPEDCDDDEAIAWLEGEIQSKRVTIQGNGTMNTPDFETVYDMWDAGTPFNAQLILDVTAATGGRILSAAWLMPSFEMTGNKGEKVSLSLNIGSTGPLVKTNNT